MSTPDNNSTGSWKNYTRTASRTIYRAVIPAALTAIIVACSGSGGFNLAGIGGSGFISSGSISSFGSIFVNGVEFETDSAVFEIEDADGSQQDLSVGMVVQVSGSINPDGISGTATSVRYGDQLEGPITSAIVMNTDGTEKAFSVLGTPVIVDSTNSVFEGPGFSFASIAQDNSVEVSGYFDQNGTLRATYIAFKAQVFDPASTVEIEGTISGLSATRFNIRNVAIDASAANLFDLDNGLQNGVFVEVKGLYEAVTPNNTPAIIRATEVEAEDISLSADADEVSIEGLITRYVSNSDFDINGIPINASNAELEPAILELGLGLKVEAEGSISNGVLNATEIESREGSAEINARITTLDSTTNSLTLSVASGVVNVVLTPSTSIEDDLNDQNEFSFSDLVTGDFVEIVGFETGLNTLTATKVQRAAPSEFSLQGVATAATGNATSGTITLLGVTFSFDSTTDFENITETEMNTADINTLISDINAGSTPVVSIEHAEASNLAIQIELE